MKKLLIVWLISLCTILMFGLAACGETETSTPEAYRVTVSCGDGGTYSLSPKQDSYEKNTSVSLTVSPDSGYETDAVSVNGDKVSLTENRYTFRVTEDTQIAISFREAVSAETYNITVSCGEGGSYTISHENPIVVNTDVTLTVIPDLGYAVSSVRLNGTAVSLSDGKYTFSVTSDTRISISFKTAKYSVSVDCKEHGTYSISHIGSVNANTEITLTVTPYSGYMVDSVLLNGTAAGLSDNVLTFVLREDTEIVISFKIEAYDVTVSCGEHGSYSLSHENPVAVNTKVTLTVIPEDDYGADKVLVNGEEISLTDGKCTFTVTKETTVEITFKGLPGIFTEEYMGIWNPNVGAGSIGNTITVRGGNIVFGETACMVTVSGDKYSFSIVDEEGDTFNYSFAFEKIFGEKVLLALSYRDPSAKEATTVYYLKDGVDYFTYEAVKGSRWEEAIGFWGSTIPIEVTKSYFLVEGTRAIVMEESEEYPNTPKRILVSETVYTVSFTIDTSMTNRIMSISLESSEGKITCTRVADPEPVLVPKHEGTYTTEDKSETIIVDEDGKFYYNGTLCELRSGDASGQMETYVFTKDGVKYDVDFLKKNSNTTNYLWLRQENIVQDEGVYFYGEDFPFNMSYTVELSIGENGTATFTASAEPNDAGYYASGTVLKFTVKANPGYVIEFCYLNSRSGTGEDHTYDAQGLTEYELEFTLNNNFYDWYGTTQIKFYVTFKAAPATTAFESEVLEVYALALPNAAKEAIVEKREYSL